MNQNYTIKYFNHHFSRGTSPYTPLTTSKGSLVKGISEVYLKGSTNKKREKKKEREMRKRKKSMAQQTNPSLLKLPTDLYSSTMYLSCDKCMPKAKNI